jgi:hypothetical protein
MPATNIVEASRSYERWLGAHTQIVKADLDFKHVQMAADPFSFMRATYYRWAQLFPDICPDLAGAPMLLGVGDLHVENFGTWRDAEGRLVWGVNDFDEVHRLAYTNDLVRLAVSARLAARMGQLQITMKDLCAAILAGYDKGIQGHGRPMVLAETDRWLRLQALGDLRDPVTFWAHMERFSRAGAVNPEARKLLAEALPSDAAAVSFCRRRVGLGSLGSQRFTAIAEWRGGAIAREAKALVPPASDWAHPPRNPGRIHFQTILERAVRCPDPTLHVHQHWVVRRLAPDCSRIELPSLPAKLGEEKLLRAMGFETANVHHGSRDAIAEVRSNLAQQPSDWLDSATRKMEKALRADWKAWRRARPHGRSA